MKPSMKPSKSMQSMQSMQSTKLPGRFRRRPPAPSVWFALLAVVTLLAGAALTGAVPPALAQHQGHEGHETHEASDNHEGHAAQGEAMASHDGHDDHAAHQAMLEQGADGEVAATDAPSIPDLELVDQDGHEAPFYSALVEDRVVAMNFVFTTCTTICPPMGANFGRLQERLGERLGRDVHLISVSVDPTVDTPARLRDWAAHFDRREGWTLVTGDKQEVDTVLKALGAFTPDKVDHAPLVLVGNDATGQWLRVHGLAPPSAISEAIDRVSANPTAEAGR